MGEGADGPALWRLPELPPSWARTLDSLRPPRGRDEGKGKTHLQPLVSDADREALLRFEDSLREAPGEDDVAEVASASTRPAPPA